MKKLFFLLFLSASAVAAMAQTKLPADFVSILQRTQMEFDTSQFNLNAFSTIELSPDQQTVIPSLLTLRSKKTDLEVRYVITPLDDHEMRDIDFETFLLIAMLNCIEESFDETYEEFTEDELIDDLNADEGASIFFVPNARVSNYEYGLMVMYQNNSRANVTIYYFFDDFDDEMKEELFNMLFALRFKK